MYEPISKAYWTANGHSRWRHVAWAHSHQPPATFNRLFVKRKPFALRLCDLGLFHLLFAHPPSRPDISAVSTSLYNVQGPRSDL